jgi:hypothetical protein
LVVNVLIVSEQKICHVNIVAIDILYNEKRENYRYYFTGFDYFSVLNKTIPGETVPRMVFRVMLMIA